MYPAIQIGGVSLSTYYLMMLAGFLAMGYLMLHRKDYYKLSTSKACLFTVLLMLSGLLGCKLLYVLENLQDVAQNGLTLGGFSFFGAVFGIPLLMGMCGHLFGLGVKQSLDASAPCVAAMVGTIRFGCVLNGCCGGWNMKIGTISFYWPTQALESIGDFIILFWLLALEEKKKRSGELYLLFMLSYGAIRFWIEFLRDTPKDWLFFSHGQWFSAAAVFISIAAMRSLKREKRT